MSNIEFDMHETCTEVSGINMTIADHRGTHRGTRSGCFVAMRVSWSSLGSKLGDGRGTFQKCRKSWIAFSPGHMCS